MKLTLPRLVTAITFVAIFAMATRISVDTDTWWHLRTGQWIVEHHTVPTADPFSHTRLGAEWKIPGWIVQVPMYWLFTQFGFAGLNLFTAFFVTLALAFVYWTCSGHPLLRAFTLVLAAAASAVYWSARPQIVSFALAGIFAYVLWLFRWRSINRLWVLVPLMAFWANAHGGFAIGFILIALTLAGQVVSLGWRWFNRMVVDVPDAAPGFERAPGDLDGRGVLWLIGVGAACALAAMVNPSGPVMLLYPFKTVSIGVLQDFIQEWQSPNFHLREAQPFLWLLFATLAVMGWSRRSVNLTDLLLVSGVAYLGFLAGRNVALLAIVAPPVLTRQLLEGWDDFRARHPRWGEIVHLSARPPRRAQLILNWGILGVMVLAALVKVALPLPPAINQAQMAKILPVDAVDFVQRTHPAGKMFNSYNFGAYLVWALYPDYPVYVDGRTDLYNDAFLREYLDVMLGRPSYEATLDKYGVNLVLVEANSLLGDRLAEDSHWRKTYNDQVAVVYQRGP
jgi:hypothetical protein